MTAEEDRQRIMGFNIMSDYPVVSSGITFQEVPGKVAVYFELGNCQQGCDGCHSPHLAKCTETKGFHEIFKHAEEKIDSGANCILLMGGTTNNIPHESLVYLINGLSRLAPTALYSGRDDVEADLQLALNTGLSYIKTGSYKKELGGLDKPTTNQKFFKKEYLISHTYSEARADAYMEDITRESFQSCTN